MELTDFIKNVANLFDETDSTEIQPDTLFHNLEEWSSLMALSLISMIDEEYDVTLRGDDLRNAQTLEELYNIVKSKL